MEENYQLEVDDQDRVRDVEYNDRKFILTRKDPFGHVSVSLPKGPTPEPLAGTYTTFEKARLAVEIYANKNPLKLKNHDAVAKEEAKLKSKE